MKRRLHNLNWQLTLGLVITGLFFFVALAAPLLAPPSDPENPTVFKVVEGQKDPMPLRPGAEVPLGTAVYYASGMETTIIHFDVYHSLIWGTRAVIRFGFVTALVTAVLGTVIGAVSAYFGGVISSMAMRLADGFLAFPLIAGVWLFRILLEAANLTFTDYAHFDAVVIPQTGFQRLISVLGLDPLMLTLILFSWVGYARIVNSSVTQLKQAEFIMACKTLGARHTRIIFRHLLPNAIAPAIVLLARDIGAMVIQQAAFAFIGLTGTVQSAAIPEWARILLLGRTWIIGVQGNPFTYWWLYVPITLALMLFGIGWNVLGDGLNTLLNPRTRRK